MDGCVNYYLQALAVCYIEIFYYYADVAELADALDLGSSTSVCRFDSCHPHFLFERKVRSKVSQ